MDVARTRPAARLAGLTVALVCGGCGLILDLDPPDPSAAALDASQLDARAPRDARSRRDAQHDAPADATVDDDGEARDAAFDGAVLDDGVADATADAWDAEPLDASVDASDAAGVDGSIAAGDAIADASVTVDATAVDAATCDETPCRLRPPQCGCPDGLVCQFADGLLASCVLPGPIEEGRGCVHEIDCAAGLTCGFAAFDTRGVCGRICGTDADCGDPGSRCLLLTVAGMRLAAGVCSTLCDPLSSTPGDCPDGMVCDFTTSDAFPAGSAPITFCRSTGGAVAGAPCPRRIECAQGLTCRFVLGGLHCLPMCVVGVGTCPSGSICLGDIPPVVIGGTELGSCAPL